jgi:hypothetical protein
MPVSRQKQEFVSYPLPIPTGGWNARDNVAEMSQLDAIRMKNWIPGDGVISLRNGSRIHATHGSTALYTLVSHVKADGTPQLIAANATSFGNVTTFDYPPVSPAIITDVTGATVPTLGKWQTALINHYTVFVNGTDQPQKWDGNTVDDAAYTGISNDAVLIEVTNYRDRLYFLQKDTLKMWYGTAQAVTGAVTEFDLAYIARKGGYGLAIDTWTHDDGGGEDDKLVIITSEGEVLVYQGDYPGGAWWKSGQYNIPKPLGRRCAFKYGGDLCILTEQGIVSMGELMANGGQRAPATLSDKIRAAFLDAVSKYRSLYGWEACVYPAGPWLVVNIPTTGTDAIQYVMNLQTGAWCEFSGWPAVSMCVHNNKLYFATSNGQVWEANYGTKDNTSPISTDLKFAFSAMGTAGVNKLFSEVQLFFTSDADFDIITEVDVDYENKNITDTIAVTGTTGNDWGTAEWGTAEWGGEHVANFYKGGLTGFGEVGALRFEATFYNCSASFSAAKVYYELADVW